MFQIYINITSLILPLPPLEPILASPVLTDRCSVALYRVNCKARRVSDEQSFVLDVDALDVKWTLYLLHLAMSRLCTIQLVDEHSTLACDTETRTGALPDESDAEHGAATVLLHLDALDAFILECGYRKQPHVSLFT